MNVNAGLTLFEYFLSNSWPFSLAAVATLILFCFPDGNFDSSKIFIKFFLALSIATLNASFFSIICITLLLFFGFQFLLSLRTPKKTFKEFAVACTLIGFLYLLPRFYPSPFIVGPLYENPLLGLRFLNWSVPWYDSFPIFMVKFFQLNGPLTLIGLAFALENILLQRGPQTLSRFLSLGLLITLLFPTVFIFKNINWWDNMHKFTILSWFFSIILILTQFTRVFRKPLLALFFIPLLFTVRWASGFGY